MSDNIWDFQRTLTGRLFSINMANFSLGRRLSSHKSAFWRGVGTQAVGWSMINIGIAIFGGLGTRRRLDQLEDPDSAEVQQDETRKLRRILAINAPLNLVYMFSGYLLAKRKPEDLYMRGNGWGIILQGFILLLFDTFHLRRVKQLKPSADDQ